MNKKGVSPVIATIMMVAITVVLAACLYLIVMGIDESNNTKPQGVKLSDDLYRDHACSHCTWHGKLGDMSSSYYDGYTTYYCPKCGYYFGYR